MQYSLSLKCVLVPRLKQQVIYSSTDHRGDTVLTINSLHSALPSKEVLESPDGLEFYHLFYVDEGCLEKTPARSLTIRRGKCINTLLQGQRTSDVAD